MFWCDKCGECCRNLNMSTVYAALDRGDGVCQYLQGDLCSIYEARPLICRVDDFYTLFFKDIMSESEFYKRNYEVCLKLKNNQL